MAKEELDPISTKTPLLRLQTGLLVVGAGAAGMAAAASAAAEGASVLLADDRPVPGGILSQCIHHGFGLGRYGRDMTGPEYRDAESAVFLRSGAAYLPQTRVLALRPDRTALAVSPDGLREISFEHCILATGCRERPLGSLPVAGPRPEGIYTAGEAQELINLGHYDIGDTVFILGSGDIGQIMARRFCLLGKTVAGMAEIRGELGGILRNRVECVEAFHIPVFLRSTVTAVHGFPRLSGVTLQHLDSGQQETIPCDTLITALGLIPDRSLAEPLRTAGGYPDWLHFCGNADTVHSIVDSASAQGAALGKRLAGLLVRST